METAKFQLHLTGGLANKHQLEGYDGYRALASAAFAISLVSNYVETGKVRHKGEFAMRHAVRARPIRQGSLIADFEVPVSDKIHESHGISGGTAKALLYGLMKFVIRSNIGTEAPILNPETEIAINNQGGNVAALVSAAEPSLRTSHDVIGDSATTVNWIGGINSIAQFDQASKNYMKDTIPENILLNKNVAVSGFLGNSGRGLVFDKDLGRNVYVTMNVETLGRVGTVFSWGLDEYMNRTGNLINIGYTRMIATDGRTKRYVIKNAQVARMLSSGP